MLEVIYDAYIEFEGKGLLLTAAGRYYYYRSEKPLVEWEADESDGRPGPLPDTERAMTEINLTLSNAGRNGVQAKLVVDQIQLDQKHAFVPFISNSGDYSMSFWVWEKYKWRIGRIDTSNGPYVWKLSDKEPSRHFLVWNMQPDGWVEDFSFYFIRERKVGRSNGKDYYTPRIQLEMPIDFDEHPYGAVPYPDHWAKLMKELQRDSHKDDYGLLTFGGQNAGQFQLYWLPVLTERAAESTGSSSYGYTSSADLNFDFVLILNEEQLERP